MEKEELNQQLLTVKDPKSFAELLDTFVNRTAENASNFKVTERKLSYYLASSRKKQRYFTFSIPKKSGGTRTIHAPAFELLILQQAVKNLLEELYEPHYAAYGFCKSRSIVDNAWLHVGRQFVFNIDLKDFFPSIEQGRVWARLQHPPFNFNESNGQLFIANFIANISCVEQKVQRYTQELGWQTLTKSVLPQGAATSPLFSNIVSERLDRKLSGLAKSYGLKYSRYADDITFSSDHHVYKDGSIFRRELYKIIRDEGFFINQKKVRLQHQAYKQEVTGLTVNEKTNVNRKWLAELKKWMFLWDRYGKVQAMKWYFEKHKELTGKKQMHVDFFEKHIFGQLHFLSMVKGKEDPVFRKLMEWAVLLRQGKRKSTDKRSQYKQEPKSDLDKAIEALLKEFNLQIPDSEQGAQL
jgi:RNA-directed DNA polymerase